MNASPATATPAAGTTTHAEPAGTAAETVVSRRVIRAAVWLPGLAVALGAAVATAHGLYEVAVAARVPAGIAWLYPLITDGLALVAYAATARLAGRAARYAWAVVVLAAGLSGLAQAAQLAAGTAMEAPAVLRFGVGAWPAVAAAIVAHLLYLLATHTGDTHAAPATSAALAVAAADQPAPFNETGVQPAAAPVQSGLVQPRAVHTGPVQPDLVQLAPAAPVQPVAPAGVQPAGARSEPPLPSVARPARRSGPSPAQERARGAAARHTHRHGRLPTVSELTDTADVSRGTAAAVLKQLRTQPAPLHLITRTANSPDPEHPTAETSTQP